MITVLAFISGTIFGIAVALFTVKLLREMNYIYSNYLPPEYETEREHPLHKIYLN